MQRTNLRKRETLLRSESFWAAMFLLPTLIGFLAFTIYPVIMSLLYSFTNYDGIRAFRWIGLQNYDKLLHNSEFLKSMGNTLYFAIGTVPIGCLVSLVIATILNQHIKLKNFYRTCFFMPTVVSMVAISVVFQLVFNPNNGLANDFLGAFGVAPQKWFASVTQAMPTVIFVTIWQGMGTSIVIFLAGLTAVDRSLYEAANIDGANAWNSFWKITLPSLRATVTFVLISNSIAAFQAFDQIYMLTDGGPAKATQTISYLIYKNAFVYFKQGYASAMAYLLFILIMLVSILQLRFSAES